MRSRLNIPSKSDFCGEHRSFICSTKASNSVFTAIIVQGSPVPHLLKHYMSPQHTSRGRTWAKFCHRGKVGIDFVCVKLLQGPSFGTSMLCKPDNFYNTESLHWRRGRKHGLFHAFLCPLLHFARLWILPQHLFATAHLISIFAKSQSLFQLFPQSQRLQGAFSSVHQRSISEHFHHIPYHPSNVPH